MEYIPIEELNKHLDIKSISNLRMVNKHYHGQLPDSTVADKSEELLYDTISSMYRLGKLQWENNKQRSPADSLNRVVERMTYTIISLLPVYEFTTQQLVKILQRIEPKLVLTCIPMFIDYDSDTNDEIDISSKYKFYNREIMLYLWDYLLTNYTITDDIYDIAIKEVSWQHGLSFITEPLHKVSKEVRDSIINDTVSCKEIWCQLCILLTRSNPLS